MSTTPTQAIQKAYIALKNGDRRTAHQWAAIAVQAAPGLEEAWLMLAACSSPRASIAYLERALEINPDSTRARQGLHWAQKRLVAEQRVQRQIVRPRVVPVPKPKKRNYLWIGVLSTLVLLASALAFNAFWLNPARADSPLPFAAQIWDQTMLIRGEPAPGALPVMAASPTPKLITPTPAEPALSFESTPEVDFPTPTELASEPDDSTSISESPAPAGDDAATLAPLETATQDKEGLVALPPVETLSPPALDLVPIAGSDLPIHIVQPDETASSIAVWYGIQVAALLDVNNLTSAEHVQPGMELRIPSPEYVVPPPSYAAEKLILVSISRQHLWAYEGDRLVYSFVVSTGMGNSTRIGTFEVLNKIPSAYGSTWNIWMPSWMGIYWSGHLQNGIHALPIMSNGAILWEGYLGTPISYGCIVLGTYEAQLLYDWAEIGTTVKIEW
jgi:LysM repeat protein